ANLMDVSFAEVIGKCMGLGIMVSINQRLDAEVIELVASEFGYTVEFIDMEKQMEMDEEEEADNEEDMAFRSPIVTIMGHVDHGKTSLLDYIRSATVVAGEAGGITQHIGAYQVELPNEKEITFLDTPGHEAFTAMRARGAKVTDIAVIVIAADDAIMPQTREAISHAQAANVPMIFAVNKIDKEGSNPQKIYEQLASMNLLVESWGGKFQSQELSAKQGLNVDLLLEKILLEAELLDLKANPTKEASGTIIEATLDKGRGYVATILVQSGTLKAGDLVVSGQFYGRVKAMMNERNKKVAEAPPSTPVLILGLNGAPQAGETFKVYEDESEAKEIANRRAQILREQGMRAKKHITLDEIGRRLALGNFKELKVIIKGDVDGSVEALSDSLQKLSTPEILVSVIHKGVGQINESDIVLAEASDAIIIGFNVRPSMQANRLAEGAGIEIKTYSIIYTAIDEIKSAMEGMMEPKIQEKIVANVEIKEVYKFDKATVAGCQVIDGKIKRDNKIRLIRDGIVVYPTAEGASAELGSLKRFKDDVKEVLSGMECGLTIKNYNDMKAGDVIEAYEIEEVKRTL
ncbi:MAG: translation initiation factor IF-2, partial [Bacteroidota bacterium]|nr:translation initiation factor IF-2 [Bacteroidota bacterium]